MLARIFGKRPDPEEQAKEWRKQIRSEKRGLERQIRRIEMQEKRTQNSIKQAAKEGRMSSAKLLAKELVNSRKAKERFWTARAQLNSVEMNLASNMATARLSSAVGKSTEIMSLMSNLIRLPELSNTMMHLSKEMEKAGVIEEMVGDTLDDALGDMSDESEAEEELDSVLTEILTDATSSTHVPVSKTPAHAQEEEVEDNEADAELQKRMAALRS
ncbi:hypothetical protein P9112_008255 [Eukaryota sp. TZLM1-RC]